MQKAIVSVVALLSIWSSASAMEINLLLSGREDDPVGDATDLFVVEYADYDAFLSHTPSASAFSSIDVNPLYHVSGFSIVPDATEPPIVMVPEPPIWTLMIVGLAAMGITRRRRQWSTGAPTF